MSAAREAIDRARSWLAFEYPDPGTSMAAQTEATVALAEALLELTENRPVLGPAPAQTIGWAHVELFGHRQMWGHVVEVDVGNKRFLNITVPGVDGGPDANHLYSPAAIYGLHPTTEAVVREQLGDIAPDEIPF